MEQRFISGFMYDRNEYQLVVNYFVHMLTNNFMLALSYFAEGSCYTYDYVGIQFGMNEVTKEKMAMFYDFDYEIYTELPVFLNSLKLACEIYVSEVPASKAEAIKLFRQTCERVINNR